MTAFSEWQRHRAATEQYGWQSYNIHSLAPYKKSWPAPGLRHYLKVVRVTPAHRRAAKEVGKYLYSGHVQSTTGTFLLLQKMGDVYTGANPWMAT